MSICFKANKYTFLGGNYHIVYSPSEKESTQDTKKNNANNSLFPNNWSQC